MSGTGSSSGSGNRKIIGFTVKKRIITLPSSATVGPQYCETVTEECTPCDGSGTGSGTGSGGGTVITDCCENPIPSVLYLHVETFSSADPMLPPAEMDIVLTYNSISGRWEYIGVLCGETTTVEFYCDVSPAWTLSVDAPGVPFSNSVSATPVACSPMLWDAGNTTLFNFGCGPGGAAGGGTQVISEVAP